MMNTLQNLPFPIMQGQPIADRQQPAITVDIIRQAFINFIKPETNIVEPESLISPIFPSSFTSSAGPNLAARAFQDSETSIANGNQAVIQPCIRYWDIDSVGDPTHLSFFEMTALTSVDGFDRQTVIDRILCFLVSTMGLNKNALWATVFGGGPVCGIEFEPDKEARQIWQDLEILPEQIIDVYGIEGFVANRHEPVGGYRTELYIERYKHCLNGNERCLPDYCNCGRFIELATSVTYAYFIDLDTNRPIVPVEKAPVHAAGFGIERLCSIYAHSGKIMDTDVIRYPLKQLLALGKDVEFDNEQYINAVKSIDRSRALLFLFADGADNLPGYINKGRRWILNKYIRALHESLHSLPIKAFESLSEIFASLINAYSYYPDLQWINPEMLCRKILDKQKNLVTMGTWKEIGKI